MPEIWPFKLTPARILVMGFAGVILLGALLLTLPVTTVDGEGLKFLDALFTATSAVCVTGLVVVDTGTTFTVFGKVVIISLIQIGGLGFMTMATLFFILIGKRIGLKERMLMQEALNQVSMEGIVRLTKYVLLATLIIEGIGALILTLTWLDDLGMPKALWYGLFHSISSFNNAGFDLFGEFRSLTGFVNDPVVNLTVSSLIILGGIGFTVMADVYRKRSFRKFSLHTKVVLSITGLLLVFGTVMIFLLEQNNPKTLGPLGLGGKILASYFQAVTPRTAGYNTLDMAGLTSATLFLIVILMFIGASPGSTGGGIKTTTFGSLVAAVWAMITGKPDVEIFQRRLHQDMIYKSLSITTIAGLLVIVVTMLLSITEKADFLMVLFETVSAFGTVGLTMGLTPQLSALGKLLIILTMFAGRLGPLTLAFSLAYKQQKAVIKQPEEKIIVG
ncbi:MAG: TrkH family potassium uptake protein [Clostridia bacterium]|nr:TrkH family potassium uptake protein [Clostridia bacterium]